MKKRKKKTAEARAAVVPGPAAELEPALAVPRASSTDESLAASVPVPVASAADDGETDEPTLPYFEAPRFDEPEEPTQVTAAAALPVTIDAEFQTDVDEPLVDIVDAAAEAGASEATWERPTPVAEVGEAEALAAQTVGSAEEGSEEGAPAVESAARLESILESIIFASDRPLAINDLKRMVNQREGKTIAAALDAIAARHQETGIQLVAVAGGWQFRTHPMNGPWVGKLVAGRPTRLSRAMLETLAIVAYRQPITRPEMDEIRGVDCGPVLKTLLERSLIRMIGKKEDVGRPILYGTTPEFLRTFSLRDLTELPTLREFHELGAAEMAKVDAKAPRPEGQEASPPPPTSMPAPSELSTPDENEEDELLSDLDRATALAASAAKVREPEAPSEGSEAPQS